MGEIDILEKEVNSLQDKLKTTLKEEEERGENLDTLGRQTEELEASGQRFGRAAQQTRAKLFWRQFWWIFVIAAIVAIVIYVIYTNVG